MLVRASAVVLQGPLKVASLEASLAELKAVSLVEHREALEQASVAA